MPNYLTESVTVLEYVPFHQFRVLCSVTLREVTSQGLREKNTRKSL